MHHGSFQILSFIVAPFSPHSQPDWKHFEIPKSDLPKNPKPPKQMPPKASTRHQNVHLIRIPRRLPQRRAWQRQKEKLLFSEEQIPEPCPPPPPKKKKKHTHTTTTTKRMSNTLSFSLREAFHSFSIQTSGFRVQGAGFRVYSLGGGDWALQSSVKPRSSHKANIASFIRGISNAV